MLTVFRYELRRNFRRPGYLFTTFGVPVLMFGLITLISGLAARAGSDISDPEIADEILGEFAPASDSKRGVVDLSGIFETIPPNLSENLIAYPDEETAQAALETDEIDVYYLVAPDYLETGNVTTVIPEMTFSQLSDFPMSQLARQTLSGDIDPVLTTRLLNPANYTETNLTLLGGEDGTADEDTNFLIVYVFVITLLTTLFMTNGYLMQTLIEEKETRLIEILISTLRPIQLLAGKILALGLLGFLQMVGWIGTIFLLVNLAGGEQAGAALGILSSLAQIQLPTTLIPILLVYFLLAYLMFAGLYSVISAISNSMREGPQYAVLFVLPATAPLYFLPVIATSPDVGLAVFLSIFPLTSPIAMTARLVVSNVPAGEILLSLALLALSVVGAIWLAARVFRVGVLLSGQPPKLRDLPKLVRG
jgi:ABC-2 type transport system permease protein